jgi:AcrR family transcriptional regulator
MAGETVRGHVEQDEDGRQQKRSPEDVAAWQRQRMLSAMVAAVADKGYTAVAVADVVQRARVSRATFYEQFDDKADCFVAAFHWCVDTFVERLREKSPRDLPPRKRLHAILETYLNEMADFPEGARVCLVELYAVGPTAAMHRKQIQLDFIEILQEVHRDLAASGEPVNELTHFDFEAVVGAISSLATNKIAMGEADDLPSLLAPVERFVLTHYGLDANH